MQPQQGQCKSCHIVDDNVMPIGPKIATSMDFDYGEEAQSTVCWQQMGYLKDLTQDPTRNAVWNDLSEDLDDRARAYLDINCYCHNPKGPGNIWVLSRRTDHNPTELGKVKSLWQEEVAVI